MAIPKTIHQTGKTDQVLDDFQDFQERLRRFHPDWELRYYDDAQSRAAVQRILPAFLPIYDRFPTGIQRADAFRVIVVYGLGGFYVDLDVEFIKSLDDLVAYSCVFGEEKTLTAEETTRQGHRHAVRVSNYLFGGEPGHPFLLRLLVEMASRCGREILEEEDILESTGPGLVTTLYWKHRAHHRDVLLLRNVDHTCPNRYCGGVSCHFGNYARHHHAGLWRWKNHGREPERPRDPARPMTRERLQAINASLQGKIDEASQPEPILVLKTYEEASSDGLSAVYHRIKEVGDLAEDTRPMEGKKVLVGGIPSQHLDQISGLNRNILYTTFESTRLPSFWVEAINGFYHHCIVPHQHVEVMFEHSGVRTPMSVIQQGFTRYPRRVRKPDAKGEFRVGFVGVPVGRKNLPKLYAACRRLRGTIPRLQLAVHVPRVYEWMDGSSLDSIRSAPFVEWTEGSKSEAEMAAWYHRLSCYVFPSSGEGWSFTPRESLYLGVPTILSDIPVHRELVASGFCRVIPTRGLEDSDFEGRVFGQWHRIETEDIANAIRDLYRGYGPHFVKALEGSRWIEDLWPNEGTQQQLLHLLRCL